MSEEPVGDLAVVLHSHMPYVEGFGTYPFGEEWLFDAFVRSHLPVLEVAHGQTITVSPVLADQLEAPGVAERLAGFVREHRLAAAERDLAAADPDYAPAAESEAERYRSALRRIEELDGDLLAAFRGSAGEGKVELAASAATHAVLPMLATRSGARLQIDAGLRSHRRRFGRPAGFWLPECAYRPGLERLLAERQVGWFCVDQSAGSEPLEALAPIATPAEGPVAVPIDWEVVSLVWSPDGYPSDPAYTDFYRRSPSGMRLGAIGGGPLDPAAAGERATRHAGELVGAVAARLESFRAARGRAGLCVLAIDTELLGHWWSEGPRWLAAVIAEAPRRRVRLLTIGQALLDHAPEPRPLRSSSWGKGKDLSTWDGAEVADLAWGARRLELRLLRELGRGLGREAALRAARELLAVQASDWAFLDGRREAGDYPYRRATTHASALLEAIDSARPPDPRLRNLAPDLSLAPLLEP